MKSPFILDEAGGPSTICMVGFADRSGSGRCVDPNCGRHSAALLNGYCIPCATTKGISPMKGVCAPITLNDEAAEAADSQ